MVETNELPLVRSAVPWTAVYKMIKNPLVFLQKQYPQTGDIYRVDAPIPFVVITGQEHIRQLLLTNWRNYRKGPAYNGFALMLGNGILNSEDEQWRKQRKMIQPSFNREQIDQLANLMLRNASHLIDRWNSYADRSAFVDVKTEMISYSLDIIGTVMLGKELSDRYRPELVSLLMKQYGFVMYHNRTFFKPPLWVPTPQHLRYYKTKKALHELVGRILDIKSSDADDTLLCRMMLAKDADGKGMSRDELRDEFLTLFVTGFETTGSAMSWMLILLAQHPEIQEKLYMRVRDLHHSEKSLSIEIMQCDLLNAVVRETLRLYPSVWLIARKCVNEDVVGGFRIPKRSHVLMCSFMSHRDAKYWSDVEKFDPERFILDKDNPSYLPFGVGNRMCVGNHFSHLEMITVLYRICVNYRVELKSGAKIEIDPKITLQPKGNVQIRLHRR
jgi:cytochrome P450